MSPRFLTLDEVLRLHRLQLERFGGSDGLRDQGLLESAVGQPAAGFGGEFAHPTIHEMGAAYLFHIVKNHPFVDGNKRTGLLAALVFLDLNGVQRPTDTEALYELTLGTAEGRYDKAAVVERLRALCGA